MTRYFLWGIGDHQVSQRAATSSELQAMWADRAKVYDPLGLKGGWVGGSVPAPEAPKPPPGGGGGSLSKSLLPRLPMPRTSPVDATLSLTRQSWANAEWRCGCTFRVPDRPATCLGTPAAPPPTTAGRSTRVYRTRSPGAPRRPDAPRSVGDRVSPSVESRAATREPGDPCLK